MQTAPDEKTLLADVPINAAQLRASFRHRLSEHVVDWVVAPPSVEQRFEAERAPE